MATEGALVEKRANLVVSRLRWGSMDLPESMGVQSRGCRKLSHDTKRRDSIREWLTATVDEEDAKQEAATEPAAPLWRSPSGEDDLALGVEASLYGRPGVRTVQEFLRSTRARPSFIRWNSFNSGVTGHSTPLSVMDVLNMWKDDPEEVLLDLGFGCDEPDISGRIPARFINAPSQARGINIQVFLEAQKNRLDLENPDVSNRFRQLEVLHQVTTAFTSLVGGGSLSVPTKAPGSKNLPVEAQERRRRMGLLLKRASKMSLTPDPGGAADGGVPGASVKGDKKAPGVQRAAGLTPLAEEQGPQEPQGIQGPPEEHVSQSPVEVQVQEGTVRLEPLKEDQPLETTSISSGSSQRKRSPGKARESFEMEEVHSFDEGSVISSYTGGPENIVWGIMRTNSTQSDSSGFLEEPFVPSLPPGPELIKTLSGMSGGSTDSQITVMETPPSLHHLSLSTSSVEPPDSAPETPLPSVATDFPSDRPEQRTSARDCGPQPSEMRKGADVASHPRLATSSLCPVSEENTSSAATPTSSITSVSPPLSVVRPATHDPQSGTLEDKQHGRNAEDERSSPPGPPPEPSLPSTPSYKPDHGPPDASNGASPALERSAAPSTWPDDATTNSLGGSVPEDKSTGPVSPGSPVRDVITAKMDHPAGSSERRYDGSGSGVEGRGERAAQRHSDIVQDTRSGPDMDTSAVPWTGSGSRPQFQRAEMKQIKPRLLPPIVETDIDTVEIAVPGSRGLSREVAGETKHCKKRSGRCHHTLETDLDEVERAAPQAGGRALSEARAGETKHSQTEPCGRFNRILETDLDEIGSTVPGPGFRAHSEVVAGGTKPSRRFPEMMETDIDAIESAALAGSTKKHSESKQSIGVYESLETHIDEPKLSMYKSNLGVSQDKVLEPTGPIAIESLGEVFETSLDDSQCDSEYSDVDLLLNSDGCVYWAEPVRVSSTSPALSQSEGHRGGTPDPGPIGLDSSSSFPDQAIRSLSSSLPETASVRNASLKTFSRVAADASVGTDTASSPASASRPASRRHIQREVKTCRSVSVQMPSFPSTHTVSHIVKRKDVPYAEPKSMSTSLPCLDTSTPLRAVQSWTDLQLQRMGLNGKSRSLRAVNMETPLSPAAAFSSDPNLLTDSRWSTDSLPGSAASFQSNSVSLDTGLWPEEHEDGDMKVGKVKDWLAEKLWEGSLADREACCCSCDRRHTCAQAHLSRQPSAQNLPYSLDELEAMICCLRKFRVVLTDIEEQVSEDQATVFNALSDTDREEVCDITELRKAVKQEAGELELQLKELAHHYDENFKMKMHRLLNEQSLLCSQLKLLPPVATPPAESATPTRSVSTQCNLAPFSVRPHGDLRASTDALETDSGVGPPTPGCLAIDSPALGCSATKPDKLDFVGFLQRLKESLRPSVNSESLE